MTAVKLPALSGDSPLGVLAAIGTLRLLTTFTSDPPRLSWQRETLTAVLHGNRSTIGEVVADLHRIVDAISEGSVLPGVGAGFPPPGAAPDRLRVPQGALAATRQALLGKLPETERAEGERWLASLVTDLAADSSGKVAISQFTAPSGNQTMATMLKKPLEHIRRHPDYLRQALTGWRRVPGVTGEYLDRRALWGATEDGRGSASTRGVPGATWLALMSYPALRTTASHRGRPSSSGWHTRGTASGQPYEELRLPIWEQPLGPDGVVALIEHPAMAPSRREGSESDNRSELSALGIIHVCRARRYRPSGSKSSGVLTTLP